MIFKHEAASTIICCIKHIDSDIQDAAIASEIHSINQSKSETELNKDVSLV